MTTIPGPTPGQGHQCPTTYPYLFVDERPGYTSPDPEDEPWSVGKRFIDIDHPRHEEGRLWQCPDPACGTWWEFHRNPTPPGTYRGMVQCITTYKPRWRRVSPWSLGDWATRRRIREHGGEI